jgi:hypothetical protein
MRSKEKSKGEKMEIKSQGNETEYNKLMRRISEGYFRAT